MSRVARITTLVDDAPGRPGTTAEHGLAIWIDTGDARVLLDTGQGEALMPNAAVLGVSVATADAIVLSHGHYDHTGGLGQALSAERKAEVYCHPAALMPKFACDNGVARSLSTQGVTERAVRHLAGHLVWTLQPVEVAPGVHVTGPVPRGIDFEDTGGKFFTDPDGQKPDPLIDDQAVFFPSADGTVVLCGCAHAGVINTLHYVRDLTAGRKIHAVIGGLHLIHASAERIGRTVTALKDLGVEQIAPAHCTGPAATAALVAAFGHNCCPGSVGATREFALT